MITSTSNQQVKHLQQLAKKARERNPGSFYIQFVLLWLLANVCKNTTIDIKNMSVYKVGSI